MKSNHHIHHFNIKPDHSQKVIIVIYVQKVFKIIILIFKINHIEKLRDQQMHINLYFN
jgi:hypothetical protein